ncbi:MAG: hypothetical protein A3E87_06525 [Gammaproteobacteria bacterium RIFCSPHIGHO2_12_FULL_35_23]|nr:MAG: hypothetical protein A3E87_06525 [Gammaproteobacteria bacterium RIFCSPHIGHO2_12_FULL_35_23]HLB43189.1 MFS transporter [Gammaproteobacteria bacterium]
MKNPYSQIPPLVWLLASITLISRSGSMVLIFLPLYLIQKLGLSILIAGEIVSFYGLGEIIGSYVGGMLSDRFSLLHVQTVSFFLVGLAYSSLGILHFKITIMVAMFFAGLFTAAARPATGAAIARLTTSDIRAKAYALNYQAVNLGATIGPALGGILASANYTWVFVIDGTANIIASIAVWLFFRKHSVSLSPQHEKLDPLVFQSAWKNNYFLILLLLTLFIGICFFQIFSVFPIYLKTYYHLTESDVGTILAINGLMIIFFQMPLTSFLNKFSALRVIAIGGLVVSLGYFILPFYAGFYYAVLSMIIITLGEMIAIPLLFTTVTKIAPAHQRGQYLGLLIIALMSAPLFLAPNICSYIYNTFGPTMLWFGIGILGIIIFIGFQSLYFRNSQHIT